MQFRINKFTPQRNDLSIPYTRAAIASAETDKRRNDDQTARTMTEKISLLLALDAAALAHGPITILTPMLTTTPHGAVATTD